MPVKSAYVADGIMFVLISKKKFYSIHTSGSKQSKYEAGASNMHSQAGAWERGKVQTSTRELAGVNSSGKTAQRAVIRTSAR